MVDFKESPARLAELLNLRSFEVGGAEKVGRDWMLDVKIPTNRISDAGNHWGLAREIAAILGKNPKSEIRSHKETLNDRPQRQPVQIKITKAGLCPRYTAQVLEVKNIGQSPKWMQERLKTCGSRPIDAVVDITNYVMLETGQPLHAFDLEKIHGGKMTIRESQRGEDLVTLDGVKHILPQGAVVIEDRDRLIDLAGIMGGENSAVSRGTKKILLQAATFDPVRIYRASRATNFSSSASKLYAAGLDPNQAHVGLERAAGLLDKIIRARRIEPAIDLYPKKTEPAHLLFRPKYANAVIGQELAPIFYKTVFERLGLGVEKHGNDFLVELPTVRRDLQIEEDLIEEAARMSGYEKLASHLPEIVISPTDRNDEVWWEERVRDFLVGAGFTESQLYEFTGDEELGRLAISAQEAIPLENPMNPETKYLSPRALTKYIASAAENLRNLDTVKIFGIGKSFKKIKSGLDEHKDLIIIFAEKGTAGKEEFYQLKGAVDELLEKMGISDHWYDNAIDKRQTTNDQRLFHPYRNAEVKIGNEKIGNIGEIHPAVLKNIKSKARIVAAEIDFEKLWRLSTAEAEYRPVGKYPAIVRDLAVVVPSNTKTEAILNIIESVGGRLLTDTDLFDYFQDEQMRDEEEKSLAFHLIFQSPDRTLRDEEVNKLVYKITEALEQKGWEVRK